jgi:hypothetical protein
LRPGNGLTSPVVGFGTNELFAFVVIDRVPDRIHQVVVLFHRTS